MDYQKKMQQRLFFNVGYCFLGLVMMGVSYLTEDVGNYLFSFGTAFLVLGVFMFLKHFRILRNKAIMHKMEMAEKDERNQMIANKARSWAFSLYIIIAGVAVITLNLLGKSEAALPYSWSVCVLVAIYWVSWIILKKKY